MAGRGDPSSDEFQDQFRRLIVNPPAVQVSAQPNALLPGEHQYSHPPPGSYQQYASPNGVPHSSPYGPPNMSQAGQQSSFPTGRPNQKQRRMQHQQTQMQYGPNPRSNPNQCSHTPQQQRWDSRQAAQIDPNGFQRPGWVKGGYQKPPPPPPMDPNGFQRGGPAAGYYQQPQRSTHVPRTLFNPENSNRPPPPLGHHEQHLRQQKYLDDIATIEVAVVEMSAVEYAEKEAFRATLETIIHDVCAEDPDRLPNVSLECFGSFKSGFASAGSDVDLVIILPDGSPFTADFGLMEEDLPRALEKRLLQLGYGARLLTRARVPIIKICEKPDDCLLDKLRQERERWDGLPNGKKYPHLHPDEAEDAAAENGDAAAGAEPTPVDPGLVDESLGVTVEQSDAAANETSPEDAPSAANDADSQSANIEKQTNGDSATQPSAEERLRVVRARRDQKWTRERKAGPLDFPKTGIGIQSDINFCNPLGLHNTQMLRCYSLCDPRVRPMVLFVKSWAKRRKINSSYSGTLSSYGYVLMVLHYLMNIAQPPVLPNLQAPWRPDARCTPAGASRVECDGWTIDFWRNEDEITQALRSAQLSTNRENLGSLLVGFFNYYSSQGYGAQFHWMQHVLSLRSPGGILTKQEKDWVKAITEEGEGKKVQHRYLFCIEDPFELSHNVARTVTHNGIVAIRDEFRRARRILLAVGYGQPPRDGELFDQLVEFDPDEAPKTIADVDGAIDVQNPKAADTNDRIDKTQERIQAAISQGKRFRGKGKPPAPQAAHLVPKTPNVKNEDDFPALGSGLATPKSSHSRKQKTANTSEIAGPAAVTHLEKVRLEKADAAAAKP